MIFLLPSSGSAAKTAPLTSHLSQALSSWLRDDVSVEASWDYDDIVTRIQSSRVHLAWAPPAICAQVEEEVRGILKSLRDGRSTYRAALVVRRGEISSLEQLEGTRAAWVERLSSGGYILAAKHLMSRGLAPAELFSEQKFVGSFHAGLLALLDGDADVTSIYANGENRDAIHRVIAEAVGNAGEELEVLELTRTTPADGLVLTGAISEGQTAELVQRFQDDPPLALLETLRVDGFAKAEAGDYRPLRRS